MNPTEPNESSNPFSKEDMFTFLDILSDGADLAQIQTILSEEYKELRKSKARLTSYNPSHITE
ncbi:MAG: hypothetical protein GF311_07120 [Candidatus Lokiarchaeota archaeon]|nr:hypothetical protein [Candidatus Lokiarchaeota archaeon]